MGYYIKGEMQDAIDRYRKLIDKLGSEIQNLGKHKKIFEDTKSTAEEKKKQYLEVKNILTENIRPNIKNANVGINAAYSYYERGYVSDSERGNSDKAKFRSTIEQIDPNIVNPAIAHCDEKIAELEQVIKNCIKEINITADRISECIGKSVEYNEKVDWLENYKYYWVDD